MNTFSRASLFDDKMFRWCSVFGSIHVLTGPNRADVAHWCGMRMLWGWRGFSPKPDLGCTTRSHSFPDSPRPWSARHGLGASPTPCPAPAQTPPSPFPAMWSQLKRALCPPLSVSSCRWPTSTRWLAASESEVVVSGGKLDQEEKEKARLRHPAPRRHSHFQPALPVTTIISFWY